VAEILDEAENNSKYSKPFKQARRQKLGKIVNHWHQ